MLRCHIFIAMKSNITVDIVKRCHVNLPYHNNTFQFLLQSKENIFREKCPIKYYPLRSYKWKGFSRFLNDSMNLNLRVKRIFLFRGRIYFLSLFDFIKLCLTNERHIFKETHLQRQKFKVEGTITKVRSNVDKSNWSLFEKIEFLFSKLKLTFGVQQY